MDNTLVPEASQEPDTPEPLRFFVSTHDLPPDKGSQISLALDNVMRISTYIPAEKLENGVEMLIGKAVQGAFSLLIPVELEIPGRTGPIPSGEWGINIGAAQDNFPLHGLQLYIPHWSQMSEGDNVKVLLDNTIVVTENIEAGEVDQRVTTFINAARLTPGSHKLHYRLTRLGNVPEDSAETPVFVKLDRPGGEDMDEDVPGHSELRFSLPQEIINDGVDADAAKAGVEATIEPYPNMTENDEIRLSWGGQFLNHTVLATEVGKPVVMTVDEATILAAGDSGDDGLAVTFEVYDIVQNRSEDWSAETRIIVDTGNSRLEAIIVKEAINSVLDLDSLGTAPVTAQIIATKPDFIIGDKIVVKLTGTTVEGDPVLYEAPELPVTALPKVLEQTVPNALIRQLAKSQAIFTYRVVHADSSESLSRGAFITVIGEATRMAEPIAVDAVQGAIDPDLASTRIQIPWDISMAAGDQIILKWIGTRPDMTIYDPQLTPHNITNGEQDSELPITMRVPGTHLKAIEGGTLELYYVLAKDMNGTIVQRESAHATRLNIGEPRAELPAPNVFGIVDGVMDPQMTDTTLTVAVYPGMDLGDYVHYLWKGSVSGETTDWIKITTFTLNKPVVFDISGSHIAPNDGGTVEASCWVIHVGSNRRSDSEILSFKVGSEQQVSLPEPSVPGSEDGLLGLEEIPSGARLIVPHWDGMVAGDYLIVTWQDDKGTAPYILEKNITGIMVGKDVVFTVPLDEVRKSVDARVTVTYVVTPLSGDDQPSLPLAFDVKTAPLPAPVIDEADGLLLDPNNALNGAHVRIGAEAKLKTGDSVTLVWAGQPGGGSVTPTKPVTADGVLLIDIAYATVLANDGHQVDLSYMIKRQDSSMEGPSPLATYDVETSQGAGVLKVMGARFNRSSYRSSATPRWISAMHVTTGAPLMADWQYEGDSTWGQGTTWRDTRPDLILRVRSQGDLLTLNPANIIGNGNDTTTSGDAALVAHRDTGDVIGWGNASYGASIPATIITMDDIVEVSCTRSAFAARRTNNHVVVWGNTSEGGSQGSVPSDNFVSVSSNGVSFAGIKTSGSVVAWGDVTYGGSVPAPIAGLTDISLVVGAGLAFAALRRTGQVVAWGHESFGGAVPGDIAALTDIVEVSGNYSAFAAMRANRRVVAWGNPANGGTVPADIAALTDIRELGSSSAQAFTLIRTTGQVMAWGSVSHGGTVPGDIASLRDIQEVSSTWQAFAARRSNGRVVAWGTATHGGTVPQDIATLTDIVQVVGNAKAFAALRRNGTVVAWGDATLGGNTASVVTELTNVQAVYANSQSFVALTSDGRVVTWGVAGGGGDSSSVQGLLRGNVSYLATAASRGRAVTARRSSEKLVSEFSSIGALQTTAAWAKPVIDEAENDMLDPGTDPDRAIVTHIPPGALKYLDKVSLYVGEELIDYITVGRNGPGPGIDFEVPASVFQNVEETTVRVWYGVTPAGATDEEPSDELLLTLSAGFEADATLDLSTKNYVVAEHELPANPPAFAQITRAADWGTGPYTYSSSDDSVATVDADGTATARTNGSCTISARDSTGETRAYSLTVSGIKVVHFLTGSTDWAGMQSVCTAAGVDPITVAQFKQLWTQYSDNLPVSTYLGWLDYPFWTADALGGGTYWTYDLSGNDVDENASSSDASLPLQAVGVSSTAAQLATYRSREKTSQ
ncbi:Ig-like domain-containing protein [Pseudomonas cichorii]|nr:Ig-like domain-containing protein [Pseudomonas cichorii]MBX8533596.1 Ig-like domain-containing protein [Pseudomonas cichorii]MBX8568201.1 Ig-like domain-containing protein [Pseudomonas cichorii]